MMDIMLCTILCILIIILVVEIRDMEPLGGAECGQENSVSIDQIVPESN